MFATFKQIFKKTNKDLKNRILYTIGALFIFALGNAITVPGMKAITSDLGFLELLNAMSGGGLKQFSIFALGVMPYITASILLQVLQMDLMGITYFQELKEMGEEGRRKINKINRYLGIGFALIEGYIYSIMFMGKTGTPLEYVEISIILTAGTAFLLYLGDQITNKGLGNGISLIIMAGIVNTIPSMMIKAFNELAINGSNTFIGIISFIIFVLLYIAIIVGVVYVQEAERRIPIQYSNRSTGTYKANSSFLPLRINSAGVMPVIFASAVLAIPTTLTYIIKKDSFKLFVDKYLSTTTPIEGLSLDETKIEVGQTMAFVTLAMSELVHVFNIRDNKKSIFKAKVFNNSKLIWAIIASAALMLVILAIPVLREIFSIPVLPTQNIVELILLILAPLAIVEIFKLLKINTIKDE